MPNMIAYAALLLWPLATLGLFLFMPLRRAIIWSLLGAYLLLPVGASFDFSYVPPFDKYSISSLATFLLAIVFMRRGQFRWPKSIVLNFLIILYAISPIFTALTNGDGYSIAYEAVPAFSVKAGLQLSFVNITNVLPFILGAGMLNDEGGHREIILAFVLAGLIYSFPILAEIRLSPFIQRMVYNVHYAHAFGLNVRDGGFRAQVFIGRGLLVAEFVAVVVLAAIGLWKDRRFLYGVPVGLLVLYLSAVLILEKSLGGVLLAAVIGPLLYFFKPRRLMTVAFAVGLIVVSYPALRGLGIAPVHQISNLVSYYSGDRAASFDFRLDNEDMLLKRAEERPIFGWGGYDRNRVLLLTSWGEVRDISTTDGKWIITFGVLGWAGYLGMFGLLCYPFFRGFMVRNQAIPAASAALIAMQLLNVIDSIPNNSILPISFLVAGALSGMMAAKASRGASYAYRPARRHFDVEAAQRG